MKDLLLIYESSPSSYKSRYKKEINHSRGKVFKKITRGLKLVSRFQPTLKSDVDQGT